MCVCVGRQAYKGAGGVGWEGSLSQVRVRAHAFAQRAAQRQNEEKVEVSKVLDHKVCVNKVERGRGMVCCGKGAGGWGKKQKVTEPEECCCAGARAIIKRESLRAHGANRWGRLTVCEGCAARKKVSRKQEPKCSAARARATRAALLFRKKMVGR